MINSRIKSQVKNGLSYQVYTWENLGINFITYDIHLSKFYEQSYNRFQNRIDSIIRSKILSEEDSNL